MSTNESTPLASAASIVAEVTSTSGRAATETPIAETPVAETSATETPVAQKSIAPLPTFGAQNVLVTLEPFRNRINELKAVNGVLKLGEVSFVADHFVEELNRLWPTTPLNLVSVDMIRAKPQSNPVPWLNLSGPASLKNELIENTAQLAFRGGFPGLRVKPWKVDIDLSQRYHAGGVVREMVFDDNPVTVGGLTRSMEASGCGSGSGSGRKREISKETAVQVVSEKSTKAAKTDKQAKSITAKSIAEIKKLIKQLEREAQQALENEKILLDKAAIQREKYDAAILRVADQKKKLEE